MARNESLDEIRQRATTLGANAIIGAKMYYEMLGSSNSMIMVTCYGTAVKIRQI